MSRNAAFHIAGLREYFEGDSPIEPESSARSASLRRQRVIEASLQVVEGAHEREFTIARRESERARNVD